jgi:RND family efflux transporter MFP subunit
MVLTRSARETLDVQTVEVDSQPISQTVLAYGTLVSPWKNHALVSSQLAGRIVALHVSPGDKVQAGQLLAEVESPDLELLQLELRTAQTELELSLKLLASLESASKSGAVAGIRLLETQVKAQQDRAAIEIARAKWLGLHLPADSLDAILRQPRQSHTQLLALKSPIDGIVTHSDLSVGKVVDPKEHLFEVLDLASTWLKIGVLEKDLSKVAEGQSLELTLTAYPGEIFRAKADVLGQFLDPKTHLGTVWATLSNPIGSDPRLLPGMSGQVQLNVRGEGSKLVIPLSSVIRDGAERFVLIEEEQTQVASIFQKQTVVLGHRMGHLIEVRGGNVFPGDRVVTRGSHELGSFFAKGVLDVSLETARDIGLTVAPVSRQSLSEITTIDAIVDVPPTLRTVASAQLGGSIHRILVDRGQKVRRGDVLAEVVSQEFQTLQLDLLRALLDVELQQTTADNLRVAGDSVSQRRLWETESQLNQANNRRDSARQRLKAAGLSDEQLHHLSTTKTLVLSLPVRAPIDGVIVDFEKVLGHVIRPEEPLFEIHDLSQVWVQGFISERDLPRVHVGQTVRIRLVADSDEVVLGTLVRSGRSVGLDDRTLAVWIELKQMPRVPVQHNMLARVTIETGKVSPTLAVPLNAVVREGTRSYVFVRKDDETFERRFVQVGRSDDRAIEIRQGIVLGEQIAVSGAAALQTGYAALR